MRSKTRSIISIAALCLGVGQLLSPAAQAQRSSSGGIAGGGGDGFVCSENGKETVYLADIYDLVKAGAFEGFGRVDSRTFLELASDIIERHYPEKVYPHPFIWGEQVTFGWMLYHTAANLTWETPNHFEELPDHPDDNIGPEAVPALCRKTQLVVQNLETGVIRQGRYVHMLPGAQHGYLVLHEALIRLRNRPNADTTPIRERANEIARLLTDPSRLLRDVIARIPQGTLYANASARAGERDVLPTLLVMPARLQCRITSVSPTVRTVPIPRRFEIVRVSGSGRPQEDARYELVAPGFFGETRYPSQRNRRTGQFSEFKTFRYYWGPVYGRSVFNTEYETQDGSKLEVSLWDFYHRTSDFIGQISVRPPSGIKVNGTTPDLVINCFAQGLRFGYDSRASSEMP